MAEIEDESLGSGLARQLHHVEGMRNSVDQFHTELTDLMSRCEQLKAEKNKLSSDCRYRTAERANLQKEIERLSSERDCLRLEIASSQDAERFWSQYDAEVSAASGSSFDDRGRLTRRVWVLEQTVKDKDALLLQKDSEKEEATTMEMAISAGLRNRIAKLEERNRGLQDQIQEGMDREKIWEMKMNMVNGLKESQEEMLSNQIDDLRGALSKEKAEKKTMEAELASLNAWKLDAKRVMRVHAPTIDRPPSPSRVLQPQSTNIQAPHVLRTPTKPHSARSDLPSSPLFSPTTSLAKRHVYLENRHHMLKEEYDKLRTKYTEDLRHWKEYKAVETARIDIKRKRKAEKREARDKQGSGAVAGGETVAKPMELVAASDASQSLSQQPVREEDLLLVKDAQGMGRTTLDGVSPHRVDHKATSDTIGRSDEDVNYEDEYDYDYDMDDNEKVPTAQEMKVKAIVKHDHRTKETFPLGASPALQAPATTNSVRKTSDRRNADSAVNSTPIAKPTKPASTTTGRVTPWLGTSASPKPTQQANKRTKRKSSGNDTQEDVFGDSQSAGLEDGNDTTDRTPLVRDRGLGPTSSLRRTALRKNLSDTVEQTPVGEGKKRRKVDMETMSPAEKAWELKRIGKMSAAEKREYYAEYKGKGRYLAPEEVQTRVYDEYEIDPKQNEGVAYQFHDVKRGKDQRKQMHGGDCECCKDYYEAIGPLPKYNQAPKWNDGSQSKSDATKEAEMEEHQNKVSRHRETWRRPPTPPGFWMIGFPNTQDVKEQNALADEMTRKREEQVRREAAHRDSKWKKRA